MARLGWAVAGVAVLGLGGLGAWIGTRPDPRDLCSNLLEIETMAILGQLGPERRACLEQRVAVDGPRRRSAASRMLLVDAFSSGDLEAWERQMRLHLTEIEPADADLRYKLALHLAKKRTPEAAREVMVHADAALAHADQWAGNTHAARVFTLHKLRAVAAQKLWEDAKGDPTREPEARARTEAVARAWLAVGAELGKPTETARALCASAAADPTSCGG